MEWFLRSIFSLYLIHHAYGANTLTEFKIEAKSYDDKSTVVANSDTNNKVSIFVGKLVTLRCVGSDASGLIDIKGPDGRTKITSKSQLGACEAIQNGTGYSLKSCANPPGTTIEIEFSATLSLAGEYRCQISNPPPGDNGERTRFVEVLVGVTVSCYKDLINLDNKGTKLKETDIAQGESGNYLTVTCFSTCGTVQKLNISNFFKGPAVAEKEELTTLTTGLETCDNGLSYAKGIYRLHIGAINPIVKSFTFNVTVGSSDTNQKVASVSFSMFYPNAVGAIVAAIIVCLALIVIAGILAYVWYTRTSDFSKI